MIRTYSRTGLPEEKLDAGKVRTLLLVMASAVCAVAAITLAARGLYGLSRGGPAAAVVWLALAAVAAGLASLPLRGLRRLTGTAPEVTAGSLAAAAGLLLTAGAYLSAWAAPAALSPGYDRALISLLALEIVLAAAVPFLTVFLAGPKGWEEWVIVAMLAVFCAVFALLFAGGYGTLAPLITVALLLFNKALPFLAGRGGVEAGEQVNREGGRFLASLLTCLAALFVCFVVPLPQLGSALPLTSGDSLFLKQPWKPLAAGAFYFTGLAMYELCRQRR